MAKWILLTILLSLALPVWAESITSISIDYPHGEDRLHLRSDGGGALYYGALPQGHSFRPGTFDLSKLYGRLKPLLHPNVPREEWPNPRSTMGMVVVRFGDSREETRLLFDQEEFAARLFEKARKNLLK